MNVKVITIEDPHNITRRIMEAKEYLKPSDVWWRGQVRSEWPLIPSVYRGELDRVYERNVLYHFDKRAPALYENWPKSMEERLFLAQHYGLRTRLLDWTGSPLTGLFFATLSEGENAGALWALNAYTLNGDQYGSAVTPALDSVSSLFENAFGRNTSDAFSDKILGVKPSHIDVRMMIQQSNFTIHGTKEPLEELQNSEEFLVKLEIPPGVKMALHSLLDHLGVRESGMFPDMEHLAKEVGSRSYLDHEETISS